MGCGEMWTCHKTYHLHPPEGPLEQPVQPPGQPRQHNTEMHGNKVMEMQPIFENDGWCIICDSDTRFIAFDAWFRDYYICPRCSSIPRERALMRVIEMYYPNWRDLVIHESSPAMRGASAKLATGCGSYIPSQFFPSQKLGSTVSGVRCENLEALTFSDNSIDLHITQDVMEHLFHPARAFVEVSRTLRPGGAHIFTVPLVKKNYPSVPRVMFGDNAEVHHLQPPEYHGNPISEDGSLVTMDWGYDIARHIFDASGLFTSIFYFDDISYGIRAEFIEVLVTWKPLAS